MDAPATQITRQLVRHLVETGHRSTAGALRAAVKRGKLYPAALEPMLTYRSAVTDHAIALLSDHVVGTDDAGRMVRTLVQMVHATIVDAVLLDPMTTPANRRPSINTLSDVANSYLGLRGDAGFVRKSRRGSS